MQSRISKLVAGATLLVALAASTGSPARAGHMSARFTREDGMNAILLRGDTYTYHELVALRAENPARFDRHHPRLGRALSFGLDQLLARQAINPRRFRRWHPFLWWLIQDTTPDDGSGGGQSGKPDADKPPGGDQTKPPDGSTNPEPGQVIPEPSSLVLMSLGLATAGLVGLRRVYQKR